MKGLIFLCGLTAATALAQTITIKCNLAGNGIQDEWQRTVGTVDEFN
jgi:hypothetical protein